MKEKKLKYNPRLDNSIYISISKEIDELRKNGISFFEIRNILRNKYPNYNEGTLILKYYEWKRRK